MNTIEQRPRCSLNKLLTLSSSLKVASLTVFPHGFPSVQQIQVRLSSSFNKAVDQFKIYFRMRALLDILDPPFRAAA